jgi:hypothetical protein
MSLGERIYRLRVRLTLARERGDAALALDIERRLVMVQRAAWL